MADEPRMRVSVDELKWHEGHGVYTYDGTPFTGVAFEMNGDALEAETEYRDGLKEGVKRVWYPDGTLEVEGTFRLGGVHGTRREWHSNGQLSVEQVGEYGILLRERRWDESGQVVAEYAIEEGGGAWQRLQMLRAHWDGR